jgi:hypothetical protein
LRKIESEVAQVTGPAPRQANPMPADWIASITCPWNCFDSGTSGSRMPS